MKIEKPIKKSVKIALVFLAIGILLGTLIAFATTPSSTFYISSGVYPGAPDYTIWREGSNYFAKDANGQIKYSGTNATILIQNVIDYLNVTYGGGTVFLKNGEYTADIVLRRGINLIGESRRLTRIYGTISFDTINYPYLGYGCQIKHLYIDGKTVGNDYGVFITGPLGAVHFEDLRVWGTIADFYLNGTDMFSCSFIDISTWYGGTYAFYVNGYLDQCKFERVWVGYQDYGLYLHDNYNVGAFRSRIISSIFYAFDSATIGKRILDLRGEVSYNTFENCRFGDMPSPDPYYIYLNGTNAASTSEYAGNVFRECKFWAGEDDETVYIGRNWNYTTFMDCSASAYFNISSFAHRTSFDTISPYRTPLYDYNPTYFDEGTNTRISYSWNGTDWIDTYP